MRSWADWALACNETQIGISSFTAPVVKLELEASDRYGIFRPASTRRQGWLSYGGDAAGQQRREVSDGTAIPAWAYNPLGNDSKLDVAAAERVAAQSLPESTAGAPSSRTSPQAASAPPTSSVPPSSTYSSTQATPTESPSSGPGSTAGHRRNASSIAGGVTGGIIGVVLLAVGSLVYLRRRRSRSVQALPPSEYTDEHPAYQTPKLGEEMPTAARYTIYNPDDPRTYPTRDGGLQGPIALSDTKPPSATGSSAEAIGTGTGYKGKAEIVG
ncbi:hypothetical protein C8Q80DRAFT_1297311 [Daedaleopsis nitida]|nr:hypothetical protein C8Q80DRAFT_1297311 [Daedaleopsis nitida]